MNKLSLLFLVFFFTLSAHAQVVTGFIKVVPGKISGFNKYPRELETMHEAFRIMEAVVNSEEFKERVISYTNFAGEKKYASNKGLSNEKIYEFLMSGQELINGQNTLGEMNFDITRYIPWNPWSKVIAYTNPGKNNWINVNGKKYAFFDAVDMASNLVHEWIHLMGFYHDSAKDHESVPYAIGYIVEDLARKYLELGYLD